MARSLNKVMLIGNLTRDPEMRSTSTGTSVVSFGLATNRTWKDANGDQQESVQFHNIVAWGKMGEICHQLLAKGMMVYVEGEINNRSWEGDDGQTKYRTEIKISEMNLLDSKGRAGTGSGVVASGDGQSPAAPDDKPAPAAGNTASDDASADDQELDPLTDDELPF